jgi:Mrp family chromosome partitioning ATPase
VIDTDIPRENADGAVEVGAKVFGVVLNNINVRSGDYYYDYQRYYHQAYYGSEGEEEKASSRAASA